MQKREVIFSDDDLAIVDMFFAWASCYHWKDDFLRLNLKHSFRGRNVKTFVAIFISCEMLLLEQGRKKNVDALYKR